ncbi:hypothetical protein H6P81_014284 [Aristolochia fimbriata]|uniref:Serine/threonine-protein phosphatase 4 regulatory subunit 2 n=1 Tax=Aristolochia fimbriata TaxID=158543 RepID=A0AAV7EKE1_ARIFI|nr:hypothetical protein H6P81_014284 [Aristolochia fimbriata]
MTSVDETQSSASPSINHDDRLKNVDEQSTNHEEVKQEISEEEIRSILEVIAATGKFWHDWNILKGLLSYRLKQVLADYPESEKKPDVGPQSSSLSGETYPELEKRLDEALLSFEDGPPFTLQRLCEILLTPKAIYTNLSKLALALEKNLLVTTTLRVCTDPYPSTTAQGPVEPEKAEGAQADEVHTENGIDPKCLGDEEMIDADVGEDDKNMDMATTGEESFARASEADSVSTGGHEMDGGETSVGEMDGGETSVGEMDGGETSVGEMDGGETSVGEMGGGEAGARESPNTTASAVPSSGTESPSLAAGTNPSPTAGTNPSPTAGTNPSPTAAVSEAIGQLPKQD